MAFEAALGVERLCTIREIADKAELGAATVHRALKGSREVHPDTRRLVLDIVCRLNEEKIARAARYVRTTDVQPPG
jgi:DNA-binding LacI/PurR family transcriptional regulator